MALSIENYPQERNEKRKGEESKGEERGDNEQVNWEFTPQAKCLSPSYHYFLGISAPDLVLVSLN